jgi:hypothetical protein
MRGKTSRFIREYLRERGEAYIHEMWKEFCEYCRKNGYHIPSRQSFGNYVYLLKKLELIVLVRREEGMKGTVRHYYALNTEKIEDDAWNDPVNALGYRKNVRYHT